MYLPNNIKFVAIKYIGEKDEIKIVTSEKEVFYLSYKEEHLEEITMFTFHARVDEIIKLDCGTERIINNLNISITKREKSFSFSYMYEELVSYFLSLFSKDKLIDFRALSSEKREIVDEINKKIEYILARFSKTLVIHLYKHEVCSPLDI